MPPGCHDLAAKEPFRGHHMHLQTLSLRYPQRFSALSCWPGVAVERHLEKPAMRKNPRAIHQPTNQPSDQPSDQATKQPTSRCLPGPGHSDEPPLKPESDTPQNNKPRLIHMGTLMLSCPSPTFDLLHFTFGCFGPFLVEVPKADHLLFLGPLASENVFSKKQKVLSIDVFFGCFGRRIEGNSWFSWGAFSRLPAKPICLP